MILHWLISTVAVLITAQIVPGFQVKSFITACVAALVIGLMNALIWPILFFLTLPINIITLFLFTFVLNGAILKMSAAVVKGFEITTWLSAIVGAIVLSLTNVGLHYILGT